MKRLSLLLLNPSTELKVGKGESRRVTPSERRDVVGERRPNLAKPYLDGTLSSGRGPSGKSIITEYRSSGQD